MVIEIKRKDGSTQEYYKYSGVSSDELKVLVDEPENIVRNVWPTHHCSR